MLLPLGAAAMGRTFLEIGAVDGLKYSNTARLERALDLRGILVEAHPLNTLRLRANQKNRPNAAIFTGAVCGLKQRAPGGSQRYEPGTVQFSPNADLVGAFVSFIDVFYGRFSNRPSYGYREPVLFTVRRR